jgi:hypothetical protein
MTKCLQVAKGGLDNMRIDSLTVTIIVAMIAVIFSHHIVSETFAKSNNGRTDHTNEATGTVKTDKTFDEKVKKFFDCVTGITNEPREPDKSAVDRCYLEVFTNSTS